MSDIPVICDRCRLTGLAGLGDFAQLGDLLDFTPVPRQVERVNGWSPDRQRAFIAALAATGSRRRAAHALGMSAYGVVNLRKSPGADGFNAAYDRALTLAKSIGAITMASGVADIGARNDALKPPPSKLRSLDPAPAPEYTEDEDSAELRFELVERLIAKFQRKVGAERAARLGGDVVAADFYLRQITALEVAFDLMIEGHGINGWQMLAQARRGGRNMLDIADTRMARVLDQARRDQWAAMASPSGRRHGPSAICSAQATATSAPSRPSRSASRPAPRPASTPRNGARWTRTSSSASTTTSTPPTRGSR
jgi:hypothetical protein